MARKQTRSPDDEIGKRLISAGQALIRSGTSIEDISVADVLQLIEIEDGQRWTTGVVYGRFHSLERFRYMVLIQMIKDGPHYRDAALNKIGSHLLGFPEDGAVDFSEPAEGDVTVDVEAIAETIDIVASEQQRLMREDPEVPVRQYAQARVATAPDEEVAGLREELRRADASTSQDWIHLLEGFCHDLSLRPAGDEGELELKDFETALSCLLDGMAVRDKTEPLRDGLYARYVMALAIGFFEFDNRPRVPVKRRFVKEFTRRRRKLVKTTERYVSIQRAKTESEDQQLQAAPAVPQQLRPAVARALASGD